MAGFISPATLEQIRAASDIVDVIGNVLPLKRAGGNFVALCPFHREKTPSFHVNPHRQIFHCFGCHKGGDVFTFVKEYENVDFPEAVRRLADRARIPLEFEKGAADQQARHIKERLLQIHEQITQRWQSALANEAAGQIARDYLTRRGVPAEAIQLFRLGYAPDLWDDTVNWARSKAYDLALVEKAGLILRKEGTENFYDRFRGRLMFPICDEQGRVVAFSGRTLSPEEKGGKYVNSPETPIFTKSKIFYGLDKSKRALLDAGHAVICEGQLDLIASYTAGVHNVVAPQGTAFTADHARILRRYVEEVILCFDSDVAGQNAVLRALDHLLNCGLAIRVALVPAPHDPDSYIKAFGAPAFKQLLSGAEGFFDYLLARLSTENDVSTDKGRLAVLRGMAEATRKTGNLVLIDKYAQKTALRLGVAPDAVRVEFKKAPAPRAPAQQAEESEGPAAPAEEAPPPPSTEFWLLKFLLAREDLAAWAARHLDPSWVRHPLVRQVLEQRFAAERDQAWISLAAFLDQFDSQEIKNLITQAAADERALPNPEQQLADVVLRLRNQHLDRELAAAIRLASQPELGETARLDLLRKQQDLRQAKRAPLALLGG